MGVKKSFVGMRPALNYNDVLDKISDAFFILDFDWRFTYMNELASGLLQCHRTELLGKCIWDEFHDAVGTAFELQYRRAMKTREEVQFEEYYAPLSTWFAVRAIPHQAGLFVFFKDITAQRQIEIELQTSTEIVSQSQSMHDIGAWEWDVQKDVISWSAGARQIGGQQQPKSTFDAFLHRLVHPDDRDLVLSAVKAALQGENFNIEYRFLRPEGTLRFVQSQGVVFFDPPGIPVKMIGIVRDLTRQKETERLLRESQERYHSLKRYNPNAICSLDFTGHLIRVNPAMERLLAYTDAELAGMYIYDFIAQDDVNLVRGLLAQVVRGETAAQTECKLIGKTGEVIYASCTPVPIVINGDKQGLYIIIQDVTKRKRTEERLLKTEQRYKLISENAQDIISYATPDGILEYVSPSVITILGYSAEELVGRNSASLYHADDIPRLRDLKDEILRGKDNNRFECRVRNKSGDYIWLEIIFKAARNPSGEIIHIMGVGRDVTERKLAEERYRMLVENSLDAIAVHDGERWVYINAAGCQLFGAEVVEEIVGESIYRFLQPDDHAACASRNRLILQEKQPAEVLEQKWYNLRGELIDTEVLAIPVHFAEQDAIQLIIRDISERKRAEEFLIQSEKLSAIGQLAAGIAHEVRNPLTSVKGFFQILKATCATGKPEHFDIIEAELNRIEMISSEMLMLAKPQQIAFQTRDTQALLASVVTLLETQAIMKNIRIETKYHTVAPIQCVENALKQVFVNLVKNAIEAMPNGGDIHIRLYQQDTQAVVEVEDEGCGIPEELLTKLGDPFFTTKESGTGLGLMVSRKIIENHSGSIRFDSHVDIGTRVTITLPVVVQTDSVAGL